MCRGVLCYCKLRAITSNVTIMNLHVVVERFNVCCCLTAAPSGGLYQMFFSVRYTIGLFCFLTTDGDTFKPNKFSNISQNITDLYYVIFYEMLGSYLLLCIKFVNTRKYPLRRYILGVLTHTTAWDRLWGGDGTLAMWL